MRIFSQTDALKFASNAMWVILLLVTHASVGVHGKQEVIVQSGNDVTINCYLTLEEISTYLRVIWKWKPFNETNWTPLPVRIKITNHVFNEEAESKPDILISSITVIQALVFQSGIYACTFEGMDIILDETKLLVGFPPDVPESVYCETNGMVTNMNCYWNPGKETHLPTRYQLHLSVEVGLRIENRTETASRTQASVDVSKSYTFLHYLSVEASNSLSVANSETWSLTPSYRVKPDPPGEVIISDNAALPGDTSCSVTVVWKAPQVNAMLQLTYIVRHRRSKWNEDWVQNKVEGVSYMLSNLASFTSYDVQVAARPSSNSFLHAGFTSEWTAVKTYHTQLLAPTEHFLFKNIIATTTPPDLVSGWRVEADWSGYGASYQPGFYYDLFYSISNIDEREKLLRNNYTFFTSANGKLTLSGRYCNIQGCAPLTQEFVDLDKALTPVDKVGLVLEEDQAIITWNFVTRTEILQSCIAQLCATNRVSNRSSEPVSFKSKTLNKNDGFLCKEIHASCYDQKVQFPYTTSTCQEYQAIISRVFTTGIIQILTPSLTSLKQTIDPPITTVGAFEATDASDTNGYRIKTNWDWSESLCKNMNKNLVLSVIYTPIHGSECLDGTFCQKNDSFYNRIENCSKSLTKQEVTSNLYGGTTYRLGLGYCCKSIPDSSASCFLALSNTDTATTTVGVPEIPHHLQWIESDPLKVYWSPPEHRNGPLDGYLLQCEQVYNTSLRKSNFAYKEIVTQATESELPLQCNSMDDATMYRLRVAAFNIINGERVLSPFLEEESQLCRYINPDSIDREYVNDVAIVAGICSCLFIILVVFGASYWQRDRLKTTVRKHIWPSIPAPNILIRFSHGVDKDGKTYKNVYEDGKTFSNTAYCENNKEDDDVSCREVPDDIRDCGCHPTSNNNNFNSKKESLMQSLCKEKNTDNIEIKQEKGCKAEDQIIIDLQTFKARSMASSADDHSPYSGMSSLLSEKDKCSLMVDSSRSTATWRTMLYPSFSKTVTATKTLRRSNSFSGNSGNSFNSASYVKDYHGNELRREHDESHLNQQTPSSVNYTIIRRGSTDQESQLQFKLSSCDIGVSSSCLQQKHSDQLQLPTSMSSFELKTTPRNLSFRRYRGESWYDGLSTYSGSSVEQETSHDLGSEDPSTDSISSLPYITIPTPSRTVQLHGITTAESSDDYCTDGFLKGRSNETASPRSLDPLQLYPVSSAECSQWKSTNRSGNGQEYSPNWTPNGLTEMPLLECYSPPPVSDNNTSYITLNEALDKSDQPHNHSSKFDFNAKENTNALSSSSGPDSYVFQDSLDENRSSRDEDLSSRVKKLQPGDMTSYVSTAQANLIGQR